MVEQLRNYYDRELRELKNIIDISPTWLNITETKQHALDRGFGAFLFAQNLGAPYREIELLFNEYKENLIKI